MGIENELRNLFQYSRDAVVFVSGNSIQFVNGSAMDLFGGDISGHYASRHIPEHLLTVSSDSFISYANILGHNCTVSVSRLRRLLVLVFYTESQEHRRTEFVSDGLLASMNVALCNLSIAAKSLKHLKDKDSEYLRSVSSIYHAYYMLKRLIGNLETAIAFDNGSAACMCVDVDLAKLCSDLVSTATLTLGGKANLSFSTDCGELIANVSPDLIERLIMNLISNSAMHTPPDGQIILGLKSVSDKAVISVSDTGSGIPPHILKSIFNAYEMEITPATLSDGTGSGLGLGICRSIAEIHGGSMIIESREGAGTSVRVLLPLGNSFAEPSPPPIPSMENILSEFSFFLSYTDYQQLAE